MLNFNVNRNKENDQVDAINAVWVSFNFKHLVCCQLAIVLIWWRWKIIHQWIKNIKKSYSAIHDSEVCWKTIAWYIDGHNSRWHIPCCEVSLNVLVCKQRFLRNYIRTVWLLNIAFAFHWCSQGVDLSAVIHIKYEGYMLWNQTNTLRAWWRHQMEPFSA